MSFTEEDRQLAAASRTGNWHLDRRVSITLITSVMVIIGSMFVQTIYVTRYFSSLEARVSTLETFKAEQYLAYNKKQDEQDNRIHDLEEMRTRLAVIERVQQDVIKRLDVQTEKIGQAIELLRARK